MNTITIKFKFICFSIIFFLLTLKFFIVIYQVDNLFSVSDIKKKTDCMY